MLKCKLTEFFHSLQECNPLLFWKNVKIKSLHKIFASLMPGRHTFYFDSFEFLWHSVVILCNSLCSYFVCRVRKFQRRRKSDLTMFPLSGRLWMILHTQHGCHPKVCLLIKYCASSFLGIFSFCCSSADSSSWLALSYNKKNNLKNHSVD